MPNRKVPSQEVYDSMTKNKILEGATKLFATKGFSAVSMKDIAMYVGIKPSSIYNYYTGKDDLLDDIFSRFEERYRHFFNWMISEWDKASSLEEVIDVIFQELVVVHDSFTYYGISLAIREQHNIESARKLVFDILYKYSIDNIQAIFDKLIAKNIIPPVDTKIITTSFMFCVLMGNDIRIHEFMGTRTPIDGTEMYKSLKKLLTSSLKNEVK